MAHFMDKRVKDFWAGHDGHTDLLIANQNVIFLLLTVLVLILEEAFWLCWNLDG